jgi:dienelactone hydrolase
MPRRAWENQEGTGRFEKSTGEPYAAAMDGAVEALQVLARQSVQVTPGLTHVEMFTMRGLLTLLWHGPPSAETAVVMVGGAMGGMLGPARGLYQRVGVRCATSGVQALRVGYRRPNDLQACIHDTAAACELAARGGAERFVLLGHSFGGAVAMGAALLLREHAAAVCTFATQSAGMEQAELLDAGAELLLIHGDADEILPLDCSLITREIAGRGRVEVLAGAGHLFADHADELDRLVFELLDAVGSAG